MLKAINTKFFTALFAFLSYKLMHLATVRFANWSNDQYEQRKQPTKYMINLSHFFPPSTFYDIHVWKITHCLVPSGSVVKNLPAMQEMQEILVQSLVIKTLGVRKMHGNPLQYSCLENSMNREPDRLQSIAYKELDMTEHAKVHVYRKMQT